MESRDVIGGAEVSTLGKMNRWVEEYSMQTRIKLIFISRCVFSVSAANC